MFCNCRQRVRFDWLIRVDIDRWSVEYTSRLQPQLERNSYFLGAVKFETFETRTKFHSFISVPCFLQTSPEDPHMQEDIHLTQLRRNDLNVFDVPYPKPRPPGKILDTTGKILGTPGKILRIKGLLGS